MKKETGSITLFVLLGVILFAIGLFSIYTTLKNKDMAQSQEVEKVQKEYQSNETEMEQKYEELTN